MFLPGKFHNGKDLDMFGCSRTYAGTKICLLKMAGKVEKTHCWSNGGLSWFTQVESKELLYLKQSSSLTYNHMDTAFDCSRYRKHLSGIAFLWGHTCFHTGLENPQPHPPDWNICWRINLFIDLKSEETSKKTHGKFQQFNQAAGKRQFHSLTQHLGQPNRLHVSTA